MFCWSAFVAMHQIKLCQYFIHLLHIEVLLDVLVRSNCGMLRHTYRDNCTCTCCRDYLWEGFVLFSLKQTTGVGIIHTRVYDKAEVDVSSSTHFMLVQAKYTGMCTCPSFVPALELHQHVSTL